jgi:hypothetical protein
MFTTCWIVTNWAVLLRVLVTAPQAKLHEPLDTDAQGFQLLSDDVLKHAETQVLNEKAGATVTWECECVKTHSLANIEAPEGDDGGPEIVSRFLLHHQVFAFLLGGMALGAP